MIHYEWREAVTGDERDELHGLLTEAAAEDAEAGFSRFDLADPVPPGSRYLLVWLLPDQRSGGRPKAPARWPAAYDWNLAPTVTRPR